MASPEQRHPVVDCRHLTRRFDVHGVEVRALTGIDLRVETRTLVAVTGPSGSGKSTLLALLGCLDRPTSGTASVTGIDVTALTRGRRRTMRRMNIAYLRPWPADNLFARCTVEDNIRIAVSRSRPSAQDDVAEIARQMGLGSILEQDAGTLSGGQQQCTALAAALAGAKPLVLVDEPTSALDAETAVAVVDALLVAASRAAILVATHDPLVIEAAHDVIRLDRGRRIA